MTFFKLKKFSFVKIAKLTFYIVPVPKRKSLHSSHHNRCYTKRFCTTKINKDIQFKILEFFRIFLAFIMESDLKGIFIVLIIKWKFH